MLRLQGSEVIYNNSENLGSIDSMNFIEGGFSITLPDGSMAFIPEEDSTPDEKEVFNAFHEFYKNSGGIKPEPGPSLDEIKSNKLAELDKACTDAILAGFEYTQNGTTYLLGFDEQDQANMNQKATILSAKLLLNPAYNPVITWKVKGLLEFITLTKEEFINDVCTLAEDHKEIKMQRYYQLCGQVKELTTPEEVLAIAW